MAQSKANSIFRTVLDNLVEARARQVSRYVNGAIMMLDDETLRQRGISRKDLSGDKFYKKLI